MRRAWWHLAGRGDVFTTKLDRNTSDFGHIIGKQIVVDGHVCIGRGVERFMHLPPWHAGESIAILIDQRPDHSADNTGKSL